MSPASPLHQARRAIGLSKRNGMNKHFADLIQGEESFIETLKLLTA